MKHTFLHGNPLSIGVFFAVFLLLAASVARGEEAVRSPRHPGEERQKAARITLSMRIAEAKGAISAQKYFRSLLRQSKWKCSLEDPSRNSCLRKAH